ncbi:IS30 family transposase (plasmid) [Mycobacterium europaeum]|nr:IS30 family transposase [Mycobacterium europaeum]MEA1161370.1 IS30 family transposase [Mycobacterium europaeum]
MRVSTETIYQAIYVHARGELKRELGKQLRRGRAARKPRKQPDARRPRFVDPLKTISHRPAAAQSREVPGYWEGDLITGASGGSAIATLVERSSRYVMLGYLGRERSADSVRDNPARHRYGNPVRGELLHERVEPFARRFACDR